MVGTYFISPYWLIIKYVIPYKYEKKFSVKKKLLGAILSVVVTSAVVTGAIYTGKTVSEINNFQQDPSNKIFEKVKVEEALDYYGGDDRYIDSNLNLFNFLTKNKTEYCNHLDTNNNSSIIVGYDKATISKDVATQFNYTINHINHLFSIINPNYNFKTGFYDEKQSDIFVSFKEIPSKIFKSNTSNVAAYVDWEYFNKFEKINDKYLPLSGQGETMATQICTVVNKLVYKWYNDGDVFDNTHGLEAFSKPKILCLFLCLCASFIQVYVSQC